MYAIWFMIGCLTAFDLMCYMILRYFEKHDER